MKIVNYYRGSNPFVTRDNIAYDPADTETAEAYVRKVYQDQIRELGPKDYTGFCVDVKLNRIIGLVRLGELTEDTDTFRVWCHMVPRQKKCLLGRIIWKLEVEAVPLSTKKALDLVYTCEQVVRYGCPYGIMDRMSDFHEGAEFVAFA